MVRDATRPVTWGRRAAAVVALVGALGLIGACAGGEMTAGSPATTDTVAPAPAPLAEPLTSSGDPALDAELTGIARFVEAQRGHPFLTPVTVELLDDAAFRARLAETEAPADPAIRQQAALLEAIGAVPAGYDLVALSHQQSGEGVLGFYDPETKALVVRGSLSPFTRVTLAHELTHALDDQWFPDAMSTDADLDPDTAWARAALAEGSAQLVDQAYRASLSAVERGQVAVEEQEYGAAMVAPEGVPPDLYEGLTGIYSDGLAFVEAVTARGGMAALDAVLGRPPTSSEQVLHPDRYQAGDDPVVLAVPTADGSVVATGRLGEAGLIEVLDLGLAASEAREAAQGWGGDAYVVWTAATATCLRVAAVTDTPADGAELTSAARRWANGTANVTVQNSDGTVRITICSR